MPRTESRPITVKDIKIKPFGVDLRVDVPKKRGPTMTLHDTGTVREGKPDTDFANDDVDV